MALTRQAIDQVVRDMNDFYQPGNEACGKATPAQMALLLERLDEYTQRVKDAAAKEGLATEWTDPWTGESRTTGDAHNPQFAVDMANWEQRLEHYRSVLESVAEEDFETEEGCAKIYRKVTGPLLDGIWYEVLPGVNLNSEEKTRITTGQGHPTTDVPTTLGGQDHPPGHSNPKPPDVISPFTLGNQVLVYKEHQDQRLREFWDDLQKGAMALLNAATAAAKGLFKGFGKLTDPDWLRSAGLVLLGVAGVGVVTALVVRQVRLSRQPQLAEGQGQEGLQANPADGGDSPKVRIERVSKDEQRVYVGSRLAGYLVREMIEPDHLTRPVPRWSFVALRARLIPDLEDAIVEMPLTEAKAYLKRPDVALAMDEALRSRWARSAASE